MSETTCFECGAPLTTICEACNYGEELSLKRAEITSLRSQLDNARAKAIEECIFEVEKAEREFGYSGGLPQLIADRLRALLEGGKK